MPGGNKTGPLGYGPMTGRRMGYCSGYQEPGYWHPGPGLGYGHGLGPGLGMGRGWRRGGFGRLGEHPMSYAPRYVPLKGAQMATGKELDHLKEESNFLREELKRIEQKISELEGEKE